MKITKLKQSENPISPTPDKGNFIPGVDNGNVSLPVDYWIEGELMFEIKEGSSIRALRTSRNGEPVKGVFISSPVQKIQEVNGVIYATTANSVYKIEL